MKLIVLFLVTTIIQAGSGDDTAAAPVAVAVEKKSISTKGTADAACASEITTKGMVSTKRACIHT